MSVIEHHPDEHYFSIDVEGSRALLEYTLSAHTMTITHTEVPPAIGGRGIAAQLTRTAVEFARSRGWDINPVCSYAAAYLRKEALHRERVTTPDGSGHS